jgi:hypothetical protein
VSRTGRLGMQRTVERDRRRAGRRVLWSAVAGGALVASALVLPSYADDRAGSLLGRYDAARISILESRPHTDSAGTRAHDHNDPATKNSISRGGETGKDVRDPSTVLGRMAAAAYVASERQTKDPHLTTVRPTPRRTKFPADGYAMANGCYRMAGRRIFFKPTDLGQYLLYTRKRTFLTTNGRAAEPGDATVWTAAVAKGKSGARRFTFSNGTGKLTVHNRSAFRLLRTTGCSAYPEAGIDISGKPHAGVTSFQEVRGYVDAHTHGMAFEFLGGDAHCGKPWHRFGAPYALVDCPDHTATGGYGGVLESVLSGRPSHDPVGWPTFKDWPAPDSLTHEGTYYRWLERSWRGGQRIFVNLLVENNQLCQLYPIKHNSCDDMDSVRLQAKDMYKMQDYIDAQMGGPGKGFYRIVKSPFQARKVINAGKMAVVMGIETSVPFGCTFKATPGSGDVPACNAADIDLQIAEVHKLGVRQMELVNKFDNALSGVAGDNGEVGVAVNSANFAETGSYWDMRHCEPPDGESHDRNQLAAPDISAGQQDALFGAIAALGLLPPNPALYPSPDHCNARGLTTLGEHTIKVLADKHMMFDPDHMSVKARNSALDQIEKMKYPGVISSHSWATPDAYPRIYKAGGFITPYGGDSTGFVEKWRKHVGWADSRYYFGIGYGADMNGLGAQGSPRGAGAPNPVAYPFRGLNGITVRKQTAGQRVWDINVDGVAQYGLYPDWIEDLRKVAGKDGDAIVEDMARGAEAYLQMWERAEGIQPDSCRNAGLRKSVSTVTRLIHRGMGTKAVMRAVGQPYTRLGTTYGFCAKTQGDPKVQMVVRFGDTGKVIDVRRR